MEKKIVFLTNFNKIETKIQAHKDLFDLLNKNFKNFYLVNWTNLKKIKKKKLDLKINNNLYKYKLFNPSSIKEFYDFFLNSKNIIIADFIRTHEALGVLYIVKKIKNLKIVMISNIGNIQKSSNLDFKHPIKAIKMVYSKKIYHFIKLIFMNLRLIPKVDYRFITRRQIIEKMEKSKFSNFLYKNNLFVAKKLILINSRSYDYYLSNSEKTNEDYIVHLDYEPNYYEEVLLRGHLSEKQISNHYLFLNKFLEKLSKDFNKKVVICIHPMYNFNFTKKYLGNFEIYKNRTREFIYNSFLCTNFSSSAIEDAVILKKKILGITSDYLPENANKHTLYDAKNIGHIVLNTKKDINYDKDDLLKNLIKNIQNYDKHIINNHCSMPKTLGRQYISDFLSKL